MANKLIVLLFIGLVIQNSLCLKEVPSLKDAFSKYFKFGTAVGGMEILEQTDFINHHFNSMTPENELKPDQILNQQLSQQFGQNVSPQVQFNWGTQNILRTCEEKGISLRGHTFVWHSQTPDWLFRENFDYWGNYVNRELMTQRLENMIKNIFEALKTQYPRLHVYAYDVANEVFLNDGGGLRPESTWYRIFGDDSYIEKAFTFARKYAPEGCKLYLNDYNEYIPAKTNDIINQALKLKRLGIIDGIGMQSHLSTDYPSPREYRIAVEKFVATGLDVQVTELDITCTDLNVQASLYKEVVQALVDHADHISAVVVWGTSDERSWRSWGRPLLFSNYQPKEAYYRIMEIPKSNLK